MAVRPPQQDAADPDAIEFGIAALDAYLDEGDAAFPATSEELVRTLGDPKIPYDAAGNAVALSEALDELPQDRFASESELLDVLHPVFEEYRASASGSIFKQLRELLPF